MYGADGNGKVQEYVVLNVLGLILFFLAETLTKSLQNLANIRARPKFVEKDVQVGAFRLFPLTSPSTPLLTPASCHFF